MPKSDIAWIAFAVCVTVCVMLICMTIVTLQTKKHQHELDKIDKRADRDYDDNLARMQAEKPYETYDQISREPDQNGRRGRHVGRKY